jgi:hypothetical protein
MYWLIWLVLMIAIPVAVGIWTWASLHNAPDDLEPALAPDEA